MCGIGHFGEQASCFRIGTIVDYCAAMAYKLYLFPYFVGVRVEIDVVFVCYRGDYADICAEEQRVEP